MIPGSCFQYSLYLNFLPIKFINNKFANIVPEALTKSSSSSASTSGTSFYNLSFASALIFIYNKIARFTNKDLQKLTKLMLDSFF